MTKIKSTPTPTPQENASPKDLYGGTSYKVTLKRLSSQAKENGSYNYAVLKRPDDMPADSNGKVIGFYGNDGRELIYFKGLKGAFYREPEKGHFDADISVVNWTNKSTGQTGHTVVIHRSDSEIKEQEQDTTQAQRFFKKARIYGVKRETAGKMLFAKALEQEFGYTEPVAEDSNESED